MRREIFLAFGFVLAIIGNASGQEATCVFPRRDQVNAHVNARVIQSGTDFTYDYMLKNRVPATQRLVKFAVQAFVTEGRPITQATAPDWEAGGRIADSQFYVWDTFGRPRGLAASGSATGLGFRHASLPAIQRFLAWGDVQPPVFREGEAPSSCEGDDVIENSFKGATVGPKPPPPEFVPIEFLNFLITLVHDSRQAGWIREDGVRQSLLVKLLNAKRRLEAGDTKVAKNVLNAFLNEVRATSCQDFTCRGNKPLTSEAFALLFFNGQFLFDRL